jgi:FAD/FMN-containing dehydrogenase
MATVPQDALAQLAEGFGGGLLTSGEPGYDDARSIYNAMIDRRPALIARCSGTADVISAVRYAREQELPIAVRCGGHSVAGHSAGDAGAVLIDLSLMKGVRVDPEARTARANGGVLWGEFDRETQVFGLATPGGRVTTTGVGGFTLGGGYGWLSTKYGLTSDNLISADVVTADGRLVTASETENEDLFWALQGGGGNFGVATSFEFRLHPVGPVVLGGLMAFGLDRAEAAMAAFRELVDGAPDELATAAAMVTAPPEPFVPEEAWGHPVFAVIVSYCGDPEEGQKLVQGLRDVGPAVDLVGPMPYRMFQGMLDELNPPGFRNYWRGEHLTGLSEGAAETFLAFPTEGLHPHSALLLFQHGGAVGRIPDDATASSGRDATFMVHQIGCWEDPADDEKHVAWVREQSEAMQPYKTGGVYLNFMADEDRVRAGFGDEKYARLVQIKRTYDPDNVFRFNQNIKPE